MPKFFFTACLGLLILLPITVLASPVYLTGMRIQPSPTLTRIIFSFTQKASGHIQYLPNPDRVIIDFANTSKHFVMQHVQLKQCNIKTINAVETLNGTLRFILTVQGKVRWHVRFLPEGQFVRMELELISVTPPIKTVPKTSGEKILNKISPITHQLAVTSKENLLQSFARLAEQANKNIIAQDKLAQKRQHQRIYTIVIDAGHGGKDPGARGVNGTTEKQVVLSVAKKLAKEINQEVNMRAVLTRKDDYYVPLRERIKLARKGNADLFIAIHADAYFDDSAVGASVFALSKRGATSEAARWLANRENYSELSGVELDSLKDRSPLLRSVLIDLVQTATIRDSICLGNKMLDALDDVSSLHHSQVEQAPFVVLKSPDIPSILIEIGFITNPHEEKRLMTPNYQEKLARALAVGIRAYVKQYAIIDG